MHFKIEDVPGNTTTTTSKSTTSILSSTSASSIQYGFTPTMVTSPKTATTTTTTTVTKTTTTVTTTTTTTTATVTTTATTTTTVTITITTTTATVTTTTTTTTGQQCHEIKDRITEATGSSSNGDVSYVPDFAIDGLISETWLDFFHSLHDLHAWFQVEFSNVMTINNLFVVMRYNCCSDFRFKDVAVYVGNEPARPEKVSRNQKCTFYEGPPSNGETLDLVCDAPTSGRYLIIQITNFEREPMMVNELYVCGYEGR